MHRRIATPSTAVLLLRTPLRTCGEPCIAPCLWVCDWCELKGAGRSRKQIWWYDDTSFKFNSSTTIAIYLGQRVHEHLLAGIHGGGRGFQWSFDSLTARATEKMRLLQLWVNIWFISILHPGEKETNSSVLRNFVHEGSVLVWYHQVWFHTLSHTHTQATTPPLYLMQMYAKYFYLHCFLILIDHLACESIQMLKNEKRRKKQCSCTRVFQNK